MSEPGRPPMNDEQVRRYGRQILLDAVGGRGQRALLAATVRVPLEAEGEAAQAAYVALLYLAGAGVGALLVEEAEPGARVGAADVGLLFDEGDVGARRAEALAQKLAAMNPDVRLAAAGPAGFALRLGEVPAVMSGDAAQAASRAMWRGSAAATAVIAEILSAARTTRA